MVIVKTVKQYCNVLQFRVFKSNEAMHKFLNSQSNNDWKQSNADIKTSGKYLIRFSMVKGVRVVEYTNIKSLDTLSKAHLLSPR